MSVLIKKVRPGSPADKAGYKSGTMLNSINGQPVNDVLDFMFYGDDAPALEGLEFDTFLMDDKRRCGNKCLFCFIDQNPPGLRETLYFKDDDSRLSFLQGNYITLTNLSKRDVERVIQMRTPVNVSVHSTIPDCRVKLMGNPRAALALKTLYRLAKAGIPMNCQLVLCPGINDGEGLVRTLNDLSRLDSVESIACVPVGLTRFRDGLPPLRRFSKREAIAVIETVEEFCQSGEPGKVFAADEFYLTAGMDFPPYEHYGTFPQYENGVGMAAHFVQGFLDAGCGGVGRVPPSEALRSKSIATGAAAFPLISALVKGFTNVKVFEVRNDFLGESITVSGLLSGGDIMRQLLPRKDQLGEELLISSNMLNADGLFLDDVTVKEVEEALGVKVSAVEVDGEALFRKLCS